jgi:hypothetical protein
MGPLPELGDARASISPVQMLSVESDSIRDLVVWVIVLVIVNLVGPGARD